MSSNKNFSTEELEFIKTNFPTMTVKEMAQKMGRSFGGVKTRVKRLGLKKRKHFNWTDEKIKILKEQFPNTLTIEIARQFGVAKHVIDGKAYKLRIKKSAEYEKDRLINAAKHVKNLGKATLFKKGHQPWNAGKKIGMKGRTSETCFKKGSRPHNTAKVGDTAFIKGGYFKIKVAEPNKWQLLNHYVWEQHNQKAFPKGFVLWFLDQNPQNCAIENLELISLKELSQRNSIHQLPEDLKSAYYALGLLKRTINKRKKKDAKK